MHGMQNTILRSWRALYRPGLEVLEAQRVAHGWRVKSTLVQAGDDAFSVRYDWLLTPDWRSIHLRLTVFGAHDTTVFIERSGDHSWRVDGNERSDLDGCEEIDISATPFCNTLALRQMGEATQRSFTMLYVPLPSLELRPFTQSYKSLEPRQWRYSSSGANGEFQARLTVDEEYLVLRYEGLFEAVPSTRVLAS